MIKTNYHTHCYLDDGTQSPELYVKQALSEGFSVLGFSCHASLPFPNDWTLSRENLKIYLAEIRELKKTYRGKLEIYMGLEVDYIPDQLGPSSDWIRALDLDYVIGSVHMLLEPETGQYLSMDGPDSEFQYLLENTFRGDIRQMVKGYFSAEIQLMADHDFDILGHCDLIRKKNGDNRYFNQDEPWYREEALKMLTVAAQKGVLMEVNTAAIGRINLKEPYPGNWMLARAAEMGIPVILNSDSHTPEKISAAFPESLSIIKNAGYSELTILKDGVWQRITI